MKLHALACTVLAASLAAQQPPLPPKPPKPPAPPVPPEPDFTPTRTETKVESLAAGSRLWVKNRNGAIHVSGWDQEQVSLVARIRDSESRHIELVLQRKGSDLDIEAVYPSSTVFSFFGGHQSPRCDMILQVPRKLIGAFRTTNGDLVVSGIEGYARCETTNGEVRVSDLAGEAYASTTNGNIIAKGLGARIKGGTTNGDLILEEIAGGIHLETTNGEIKAKRLDGWNEGIHLETTNGDVEVELGHARGEVIAENTNGSLEVHLPGAESIEVSKHHAHVRLAGRTQQITLETTNGDITVK
ncbi:MAG TPA: DUF4097 family beta strand repeat-containing protein [Holophagaceae bacterium]|nr:DUF4097 family beta strand repeat-containing protein [Holophagaceae bacterium]